MKKLSILSLMLVLGITMSFAQVREIPKAVEETFTAQYPGATDVDYKDQLVRVDVSFTMDGDKKLASYTNKGVWKETWTDWTYDKLPVEVQDGFKKSKYADREVEDVIVVSLPGGGEQYRLKTKKNDVQKTYLFFNPKGRLLRTSLTI